jgi:adenosylhomocysteine nucleosidase
MLRTGIIGAMQEEVAEIIAGMRLQAGYACSRIGMRDYHVGAFDGQSCVVVLARIGKVAAAVTAVTLIREFNVDEIIFTGLAGGLAPSGKVGDVVIAGSLVQHDLDARPFFPRHEVPLLGVAEFVTDAALCSELENAAMQFFATDFRRAVASEIAAGFGIGEPALHCGLVLSGDRFVGDADEAAELLSRFPDALAVEMEGAAVAQVCHEHVLPCAILRTISDRADANAHVDFGQFLTSVASTYSDGILRQFFRARHVASGATPGLRALVDGQGLA